MNVFKRRRAERGEAPTHWVPHRLAASPLVSALAGGRELPQGRLLLQQARGGHVPGAYGCLVGLSVCLVGLLGRSAWLVLSPATPQPTTPSFPGLSCRVSAARPPVPVFSGGPKRPNQRPGAQLVQRVAGAPSFTGWPVPVCCYVEARLGGWLVRWGVRLSGLVAARRQLTARLPTPLHLLSPPPIRSAWPSTGPTASSPRPPSRVPPCCTASYGEEEGGGGAGKSGRALQAELALMRLLQLPLAASQSHTLLNPPRLSNTTAQAGPCSLRARAAAAR